MLIILSSNVLMALCLDEGSAASLFTEGEDWCPRCLLGCSSLVWFEFDRCYLIAVRHSNPLRGEGQNRERELPPPMPMHDATAQS